MLSTYLFLAGNKGVHSIRAIQKLYGDDAGFLQRLYRDSFPNSLPRTSN